MCGLVRFAMTADKPEMDALAPLRAIVDYALPPRCAACGEIVAADHHFCGRCWSALRFLGDPCCACCRRPFAYARGSDARCGACLAAPPRHAGVYAAVAYDDVAGALAVRLKHGGRIALAETMARSMVRRLPPNANLLVPVPLHRWRLWSRGFNQAVLIARALSRLTGLPTDASLLERRRATALLRGLGRRRRAEETAGAFAVSAGRRDRLRGRRVVLVDDVYTTGATADGCVRALRRAGAASVAVLCWARVLPDAPD